MLRRGKMPKVSVIIPVYNVETYLRKCLDSVKRQTLADIEIICVDDGSTDSCPEILDEYARKEKRMKVIHKANAGYGHAVNVGFENAAGEYIGIVESDDYILPDMYEVLYSQVQKFDLEVVKSDYYLFGGNIYIRKPKSSIVYNQVLGKTERKDFFGCPIANWSGLYKREFLAGNRIRHNETPGASYQDIGFWIQVMSMAERIMWLDQAFYMYRQDNPSQSVKNKTKMMNIRNEYQFAEKMLTERGLYRELDYMNAFRIQMYKFAFYNRIGAALKRKFAEMMIQDYKKYHVFTYAKDAWLDDDLIRWYGKLMSNMEQVCADAVEKMNFSDGIGKMIIYGAGRVAEHAYIQLCGRGLIDRLRYIAVSRKDGNSRFKEHEIKEIGELEKYKDDLVIVAVKKGTRAYNEMITTLEQYGFRNYMDYEHMNKRLSEDYDDEKTGKE